MVLKYFFVATYFEKKTENSTILFHVKTLFSIEPNTTLKSSSPWFHWKFINTILPSSPFPNQTPSTLSLSNRTFSLLHHLPHKNFLSNSNPNNPPFHSPFKGFQISNYHFSATMNNLRTYRQKEKCIRRHCSWLSVPCLLHSLVWSISWAILLPLRFVVKNQNLCLLE